MCIYISVRISVYTLSSFVFFYIYHCLLVYPGTLMSQNFIIPTILNIFIGIWYYVFMAEMNSLEKLPLHVFCVIARSFYGMLVSFPLDIVLQVVLARMTVWVAIFILALDMFQFISIINQFDAYNLTDALSILFGVVFMISDAVFIIQLYRHSTEQKITTTRNQEGEKEVTKAEPEMIEVLEEVYDTNMIRRRPIKMKF